MSPITPPQTLGNSQAGQKARSTKKKRVTHQKLNGNSAKSHSETQPSPSSSQSDGSEKNEECDETKEARRDSLSLKGEGMQTNNDGLSGTKNTPTKSTSTEIINANTLNDNDACMTLEAMSHQRESLLAEVEQFRKSLEDIQDRHESDLNSIKRHHAEEISKIEAKSTAEISAIIKQHSEEIAKVKTELEESVAAKVAAETQYQNLLERVNIIKSSLGERFKADREELAEAKSQIEELENQKDGLEERAKELEEKISRLVFESQETSKEISSLRNQYNLSQHNLTSLREDLVTQTRQLKDEANAAKEATSGWEMLAMEERSVREALMERIKDLEEQVSSHRLAFESAVLERDNYLDKFENLHQTFRKVQDVQKKELTEIYESHQSQVKDLQKLILEADSRTSEAVSSRSALQAELERLTSVEKELKEKNLLIGKLRHEAIVLNDHLTKALRFLKKSKPEDNIDRQIVTNHFLHFLALDRSDPKKFQILQLIASLLSWTDEQKEQAGLARPGTSNSSQRLPPINFHRTPSINSLSLDFFNDTPTKKESLADLWKGFLEQSTEENETNTRNGSLSTISTPKTETET